ncbi:MAG: DNA-3-methyladenine glycosylase [Roseovarius sp.]
MSERIIHTLDDVEEGAAALALMCPRMKHARGLTGPLPLRRKPDGFAQLLSAIVGQQVSIASAAAIWARIETAGLTDPDLVKRASDEDLRAVGLSRQKIKYAKALADADLDYVALRGAPSDQVITQLVQISGIGPWTAEVYTMFSLGRADVFAPGDLALAEAARVLYDLPERPKERAFREMAQAWRPWRSVAARILWAYYRVIKDKEGIR